MIGPLMPETVMRDGYGDAAPLEAGPVIGPVLQNCPVAGLVVGVSTTWVTD